VFTRLGARPDLRQLAALVQEHPPASFRAASQE
jgi:hypothetical protein